MNEEANLCDMTKKENIITEMERIFEYFIFIYMEPVVISSVCGKSQLMSRVREFSAALPRNNNSNRHFDQFSSKHLSHRYPLRAC